MLTIYKRGDVWWIRGTAAGRRHHRSTGTGDRSRAEEARALLEAAEWKRRHHGPESVLTFGKAALLYLDAGKSPRFLPPLIRHFDKVLVRDINAGTIRQAAIELYPRAAPATRNRQAIAPAQAVINHAASLGHCHALRVDRFKVQKVIRPYADLAWIEAFAVAAPPRLGAMALFMFLTGARISSATKLVWRDVTLARAEAIFRRPKGQDDARAHLPAILVTSLANLDGQKDEWRKVFGFASRHAVYRAWGAACRKAGIEIIPPHRAGRHGFATGLLRQNVDPVTVARLGHWASPRHVYETYGHPLEDRTLTDRLLRKEK